MVKQALQGKRKNAFLIWPEDIVIIGHDTDDRWEHPLYDPRAHDEPDAMLAASIAAYGEIHTPVTVIKDGVDEKGNDIIVCKVGRGRIKAARSLNETRQNMGMPKEFMVPCMYDRKSSSESMMAHLISENQQRRSDELPQQLRKLERYLRLEGATIESASIHFRRTKETINRWIKFNSVCDEWQKVVFTGGGSMVDVLRLLTDDNGELLPHAKQVELFRKHEAAAEKKKQAKLTGKLKRGRPKGPTRRTLEKVLEAEDVEGKLHPEFIRALQFVTGRINAEDAGVSELVPTKKPAGRR